VAVNHGGAADAIPADLSEAANGAGFAGLTAVGKAEIEDSHGTILAALTFTNISPVHVLGSTGFVAHTLPFTPGPDSSCVTVRFSDLTPNGGVGIDVAIDGVSVQQVPLTSTGTCVTAAVVYSAITNGGFEAGLAGWSYNAGVYQIGHPVVEPIGVDGNYSADLGGADIAGAKMWQSIMVVPQTAYRLTFSEAANGAGFAGLTAVGKA